MNERLRSSLHWPDRSHWRSEHGYSDGIAMVLTRAYLLIRVRQYLPALDLVLHTLHHPMAERQRLHMLYVLALAYTGLEEYSLASLTLAVALDLAPRVGDRAATAELHFLRGGTTRATGMYSDATHDYMYCLDLIYDLGAGRRTSSSHGETYSADPVLELDSLIGLSIVHFSRGRHELCTLVLNRAHTLAARMHPSYDTRLQVAQVQWMEALVARWTGSPWKALASATSAAAQYEEANAHASAARLFTVVADVALDCQASITASPVTSSAISVRPADLLARAHREAQRALDLARGSEDSPGEVMALLSLARHARMVGSNDDRLPTLEASMYTARHLDDTALVIQVLTALGDELAGRDERSSAIQTYRQVLAVADQSEMPVMAKWARDALAELLTNE